MTPGLRIGTNFGLFRVVKSIHYASLLHDLLGSQRASLPYPFPRVTPSTCTYRFRKYWARVHFKGEPHEYVISLDFLTLEEIKLKKKIYIIYEDISYEEGFVCSDVNPLIQRKQLIDTYVIMGVACGLDNKETFGEDRESSPHWIFLAWDVLIFADKMNSLKKVFDIAKERKAKVYHGLYIATEIPQISSGRDQPFVRTTIVCVEDWASSPPNKKIGIQTGIKVLFQREIRSNRPGSPRELLSSHLHLFLSFRPLFHPIFLVLLKKQFLQYLRKIFHTSRTFLRRRRLNSFMRLFSLLTG